MQSATEQTRATSLPVQNPKSAHILKQDPAQIRNALKTLETVDPWIAAECGALLFMGGPDRTRQGKHYERPVCDREFQFNTRDGRLTGFEWGQKGPSVLLCHGWEADANAMLGFVAPLLARGRKVVAFDAPGHGCSEGRHANMGAFARAIEALYGQYGTFGAIVGHSLGGAAAVMALEKREERQPRLALISVAADAAASVDLYGTYVGVGSTSLGMYREHLAKATGKPLAECFVPTMAVSRQAPVLIVHDRNDLAIPFADAEQIAAGIAGSQIHATTGLGHKRILLDSSVVEKIAEFVAPQHSRL